MLIASVTSHRDFVNNIFFVISQSNRSTSLLQQTISNRFNKYRKLEIKIQSPFPSRDKMFKPETCAVWAFVWCFWGSTISGVDGRVVWKRSVQEEANIETLELVHVVFRHGDRTPDRSALYKNDPHINVTYYPIGNGQLTNAGKRKEYNIGKQLRQRYYRFLRDDKFTLDTVDARCTDYNRTKMSLQLVLASLFPPRGSLIWENRLDWQPVPFNYWPIHEDHVLADPLANCPRYNKLFWNFLNSTAGQGWYENYTDLINYLEHHTGTKMNSKAFADLYFTLTTEKENGYDHPEWVKDVYHHIQDLAIKDYNASTATDELKRYAVGFLVKKIVDDSYAKTKGEYHKGTKIFLYSAHEFNVAILLRYLDVFNSHVPPYGSYIIAELHNHGGVRGLKFFYQDYTEEHPRKLVLPGCGTHFCKLSTFVRVFGNMFPRSETECFDLEGIS